MTSEDKQLLLKDLCARLPYGVMIHNTQTNRPEMLTDIHGTPSTSCWITFGTNYETINVYWNLGDREDPVPLPYLRPMSSMTEEELKEFRACHCVYDLHPDFQPMMCNIANEQNMFDWLLAHHFDYRGLIEKGLALEAPEGMYKTE